MLPLIGLTTYERDDANKFLLPAEYVDAVRRAGGIPLLVPHGEEHLAPLLARLDGLVLTGGVDVGIALYGGQPHPRVETPNPERDRTELRLVEEVLERGMPALCICRGAQLLNVALGGTLVEHLVDEVGEGLPHQTSPTQHCLHPVTVQAGSRLAAVMGAQEAMPASWHHQAIRRPAGPLHVVAQAADGTIEAVEHPGHPWLLAVQWHPEITAAQDPAQQRIFDALVEAARGFGAERSG